jgi:hypothetical protein
MCCDQMEEGFLVEFVGWNSFLSIVLGFLYFWGFICMFGSHLHNSISNQSNALANCYIRDFIF